MMTKYRILRSDGTITEVDAFKFDRDRAPGPPTIPAVVSMRQARLALRRAGVLANVDAMMAQADEETTIEWEYATEVRRDHPMIAAMGQGLGLDDAAIDALFVAASAIE